MLSHNFEIYNCEVPMMALVTHNICIDFTVVSCWLGRHNSYLRLVPLGYVAQNNITNSYWHVRHQ